ncbi:MAG TPA: hypothetical protein VKY41_04185 [Xanthomarina sp.]|nr:hypothetical protein [Xanthomarina sp.]
MHVGSGPGLTPRAWGDQVGSETNVITVNNMPLHSHTINAVSDEGDSSSPTNNFPADTKLLDK